MTDVHNRQRLRLRMSPDPARLITVRRRLSRFLLRQGVDGVLADQIVLCVSEALNNAILHSRTKAPIIVEAGLCENDITVRVSDEGIGLGGMCLDPSHVADPSQPSGRGFFLIWSLMDELEVTEKCGTTVRMTKHIGGEGERGDEIASCGDQQPAVSCAAPERSDLCERSPRKRGGRDRPLKRPLRRGPRAA